jgi:RHS Repeat
VTGHGVMHFTFASHSVYLSNSPDKPSAYLSSAPDRSGNSFTLSFARTARLEIRGRLNQAISFAGTTNYQINSFGQRIRKMNPQGDTVYHYDNQGRLIAESTPSGQIHTEYIYLRDMPVAVLK